MELPEIEWALPNHRAGPTRQVDGWSPKGRRTCRAPIPISRPELPEDLLAVQRRLGACPGAAGAGESARNRPISAFSPSQTAA